MKIAAAALVSVSFVSVSFIAGAHAQQTAPAAPVIIPPSIYMPFVWNGNALDQKILDAQAQMIPTRPITHHHPRQHRRHQ